MTILDFEKRFSTEEACHEYLAKLRWPNGFCCPRCNHDKAWRMERGVYWRHRCNYQVSVTAGTFFQGSRKPLMLWFRAIWWVVSQKMVLVHWGSNKFLDSVVIELHGHGFINCAVLWFDLVVINCLVLWR